MARFFVRKAVLFALCVAVFLLSVMAGAILSALLIRAPEL